MLKKTIKTLAVAGVLSVGTLAPSVNAMEIETSEGDEFAVYGYSLSPEQQESTKRLLNAQGVELENEIDMDQQLYADIFGGDAGSVGNIYSSAHVTYEKEGHGVKVNIVTPENITSVSENSYVNAAITSGMKDVTLDVASTVKVTGEGALAGVYAVQKELGKEINEEDAKLANEELVLNSELEEEIASEKEDATEEETDALTNSLLADIKNEIAELAQSKNDETVEEEEGQDKVSDEEVRDIVINVVNNYGLDLSEESIQKLEDFAKSFSKTEIALDPEMKEQLSQLGNTLKEQGGKFLDGVKSKLNDPDVQESAKGLWASIVDFFKNLFSSNSNQ